MWKMTDSGQINLLPVLLPGNRREPGNAVNMRFSGDRPHVRASSIALDRKSRELDFRFFYLDRDVDLIEAVFCRIMGSVVLSESGRTPGKQAVPP